MSFCEETHTRFLRDVKDILRECHLHDNTEQLIATKITNLYCEYCEKHDSYILSKVMEELSK